MVGETLACWYEDPSNPARPRVESDGNSVTLFHDIRIAERLRVEVALSVGVQALLLERAPWHDALPRIYQVMTRSQANPATPPEWVADAAVFVTHPAHFGGACGLVDALDAIQCLGCTALCLLPVHDIAAPHQYTEEWSPAQPEDLYALRSFAMLAPEIGGIEGLRDIVAAAHARGMRVILDLPLSGCAADSPYVAEHPDWFCLDQSGQFIRFAGEVDTFYFDWRNNALRTHAVSELMTLMEQTGIDGFRVLVARDVPPGWPLGAAIGGSTSMGVVRLIEMLYTAMRQIRPDAALVTDLAGPLPAPFRNLIIDKSAHHMFTYLAIGMLGAAEMQEWLIDNLAIGNLGGLRACFTESHHSCVSNPLADALRGSRPARMILAGMVGCGYVPLIRAGQEQEPGDRDSITRLLHARARSIALRRGVIDPNGVRCDDPAVFAVLRRHPEECVVTLLNVSPIRRRVTLALLLADLPDGDYLISDLLGDDPTQNSTGALRRDDLAALSITLAPFAYRLLALRLLPLHPDNSVVDHAVHSDNVPRES
jgi:Glycosidases